MDPNMRKCTPFACKPYPQKNYAGMTLRKTLDNILSVFVTLLMGISSAERALAGYKPLPGG
jgi:hypothetical protein